MRTVSIVIPNWNGWELLKACLEAIRRQTYPSIETIVVDNGSTDESCERLRAEYPEVHLIALPVNAGFAAAVNRGIMDASGPLVALLNNDTEPDPEWISRMVARLDASPDSGSVACMMINYFDHSLLDGAGDMLSRSGLPFTRGFGEPDDGRYSQSDEVFGPCAGACLYRKSVFERIGLFDEHFVSYYEDVDVAFRAQMAGFRCVYAPDARCFHRRGATAKRLGPYAAEMQERNTYILYAKTIPCGLLLRKLPYIVAGRVRHWIRAARDGNGTAVARGFVRGVKALPHAIAQRKDVQSRRTIPLSSLEHWFGK